MTTPPNPWYNRSPIRAGTRATAEQIDAEFEKIEAALAQLPAPGAIPAGGGQPNYTWYAYADSADGTANFTTGAPGNRAYVGTSANRAIATESTHPEDYVWARLRGAAAPNVVLQFSVDNAAWHVGYQSGDIYWRQSVDGGVSFTTGAQLTAADLTDLDPVAAAKLAGIQAGADQTAGNTPRMSVLPEFLVRADYTGTINPGALPLIFSVRRFRGNTDVTLTTSWAIFAGTGLTATIDDGSTSPTRGQVTITGLTGAAATYRVVSSRDGVDIEQLASVTRADAAPPQTTGGGGGSGGGGTFTPGNPATDNSFPAIGTSTTHTALSDVLAVVVGSSGQVNCTAPLGYNAAHQGTIGFFEGDPYTLPMVDDGADETAVETYMAAKWQYSADGTSGWSDLAAEVTGSAAYTYFSGGRRRTINVVGNIACAQSKSGLTPGATAYFRLVGRMVAAGYGIAGETGQVVVTPV